MSSITVHSEVTNGHLTEGVRNHLYRCLKQFDGKKVTITIKQFVKTRSDKQNRFMHGPFFKAIIAAHAEAGEQLSLDEVKELFKRACGIKVTMRTINGDEIEVLKSTSKYSTIECEECMERARAEYAQYGHYLPFPNEQYFGGAHA